MKALTKDEMYQQIDTAISEAMKQGNREDWKDVFTDLKELVELCIKTLNERELN